MENEYCSRLFEIATKNMQRSEDNFESQKAVFSFFLENSSSEIDALALLEMQCRNEDFLDIAYTAFFDRTADESALEHYSSMFSLTERQFRLRVISDLARSEEAVKTGKMIVNFLDVSEKKEKKSFTAKLAVAFLPLYRRLPNTLKNVLKKLMGAGAK